MEGVRCSVFIAFALSFFVMAVAIESARHRGNLRKSDADTPKHREKDVLFRYSGLRTSKGELVVEKFVETLMASERYLKMIEVVDRKMTHLDSSLHEKTNSILKYMIEILRLLKSSPVSYLENSLKSVKGDLERLKRLITQNSRKMRGTVAE